MSENNRHTGYEGSALEEREYKYMLSEEEYGRIAQWMDGAGAHPGFVQINYFYDTGGYDLDKRDVTLRVRQAGDRLLCQCKFESDIAGNEEGLTRTELEKEIDGLPKEIDPGALFDHPVASSLPVAYLLGTLVTERRICAVEPGVEVMLDRSQYLGRTDWELEIEYQDGCQAPARRWCERLCPGGGRVMGKRARFMEAHRCLYG